jgi:hypothetical protein
VPQRGLSVHVRYGAGRRDARVEFGPFRYAWPAELGLMARLAGLDLESRSADVSVYPQVMILPGAVLPVAGNLLVDSQLKSDPAAEWGRPAGWP